MAMKNQGGDYFYVRDCYDDYYHIILTDLLKIKKREAWILATVFDETRAVNAWEVIGVLTKLHYLDKIDQVAFVFIVPRDLFHSFKQQSIVSAKVFTSTWVDSITAFDRDTRETLSNYDVTSFAQLAEAVNPYKRGEIRLLEVNDRCAWDNAVRCWEMHAKAVTRNSAIEKILQFVCAI
ncbi:hypothetical protein PC128_g24083 [Phytophthora cactorum]|nr:hypothetical protein PC128_g24083 [Phytophthora cactorum]